MHENDVLRAALAGEVCCGKQQIAPAVQYPDGTLGFQVLVTVKPDAQERLRASLAAAPSPSTTP